MHERPITAQTAAGGCAELRCAELGCAGGGLEKKSEAILRYRVGRGKLPQLIAHICFVYNRHMHVQWPHSLQNPIQPPVYQYVCTIVSQFVETTDGDSYAHTTSSWP